jgi:hypothetical protein
MGYLIATIVTIIAACELYAIYRLAHEVAMGRVAAKQMRGAVAYLLNEHGETKIPEKYILDVLSGKPPYTLDANFDGRHLLLSIKKENDSNAK